MVCFRLNTRSDLLHFYSSWTLTIFSNTSSPASAARVHTYVNDVEEKSSDSGLRPKASNYSETF